MTLRQNMLLYFNVKFDASMAYHRIVAGMTRPK